jgi:hypothetical protein
MANRNTSSLWASSLLWREKTFSLSSSLITIRLANDPSSWSSRKFCNRTSLLWLIRSISLFVCWQIWTGFGSALCKEWVLGVGVWVSGGVWGDPMGRWDGISRFVLIIHAYNLSDDFFERSQEIRSLACCFSYSSCHSSWQIVWKRWSRNRISMNVARSLLVKRIAVAISSCCRRAFMQNSRLMYQCGTCLEEEEWWKGDVAGVRGILLTVILLDEVIVEVLGGSVVDSLHKTL